MTTITATILIFIGILSIFISSSVTNFNRGLSLLIFGIICFMVGYFIFPKQPPKPIKIKSEKVINVDSIYIKGYKDGIKDCKNN